MLPVFPVYITSLCVSKSVHPGALPGPAYPYFDNHRSTEIHTASFLPGPWVVRTASVFGDAQAMILEGHDTGMMIPHLSPIMDNALLPMTLLTSSCTFPFMLSSRKCRGKAVAGFFPAYAPFLFCNSETEQKPEKPGEPKPKQPTSSDDIQKQVTDQKKAAHQRKLHTMQQTPAAKVLKAVDDKLNAAQQKAKAVQGKLNAAQQKVQDGLNAIGGKTKYQLNIKGRGRICIPTKATILMELSFADLLHGWGSFLFARSLDALFAAGLACVPRLANAKNRLAERFDESATKQKIAEGLERLTHKSPMFRQINRAENRKARQEVYRVLAKDIASKGLTDAFKALVTDGKVKAPLGLFNYSLADGKGTVFWWGKLDGTPLPFDFKGLNGPAKEALKGLCYQPAVKELVADNPNYAAAPKQPSAAEPN